MANFTAELNVRLIRKILNEQLTKKPSQRTKNFIELVVATAKLINRDLDKGKFHLDLSDKRLGKEFGVTAPQAKRIRMKLQEIDATYIPEGQKQYAPGTYPNWLILMNKENKEKDLVVITERDQVTKKKMPPVNTRYNKTYCDLYYEAVNEIMAVSAWSIKTKMMNVHSLVNEELALKGLTREDCRI